VRARARTGRARWLARVCGVAACCAAAAAAQTLGPSPQQLDALVAGDRDEPIAFARFLRRDEERDFARYLAELEADVRARGGVRVYAGDIDPGSAAPERWDSLVIDVFPTRRDAVESLRALEPVVVSLGLEDSFVLALRPWSRNAELAAGAVAWVFRTFFAREIGEPLLPLPTAQQIGPSRISPDPERLRTFVQADPAAGFAMLNLNQLRERASYPPDAAEDPESTGADAYRRYSLAVTPEIMRRGGTLLFAGEPIGSVVGAAGDTLDEPWQQLVLVHYPSRRAFASMLADTGFRAATRHRVAALERAIVLPTVPWAEFDPAP
jgi:uncharacterized protein (DUF1330 family)